MEHGPSSFMQFAESPLTQFRAGPSGRGESEQKVEDDRPLSDVCWSRASQGRECPRTRTQRLKATRTTGARGAKGDRRLFHCNYEDRRAAQRSSRGPPFRCIAFPRRAYGNERATKVASRVDPAAPSACHRMETQLKPISQAGKRSSLNATGGIASTNRQFLNNGPAALRQLLPRAHRHLAILRRKWQPSAKGNISKNSVSPVR